MVPLLIMSSFYTKHFGIQEISDNTSLMHISVPHDEDWIHHHQKCDQII